MSGSTSNPGQNRIPMRALYYAGRGAVQRGGFRDSTQHIVPEAFRAFTWHPTDRHWHIDTFIPGFSTAGLKDFNLFKKRAAPTSEQFLGSLFNETVLNGFRGRPEKLEEILADHPLLRENFHAHPERYTLSSPLPLYYESGTKKHVYVMLLFLLDRLFPRLQQGESFPLREFKFALKISRADGAISQNELDYHTRLSQAQVHHGQTLSHLLGWYDLNAYPQLNLPSHILSIESFEPGIKAEHWVDQGFHEGVARAVTACAFRLTGLALRAGMVSSGFGCDPPTSTDRYPDFFNVRFPGDINSGNFLLRGRSHAVFIDPGYFQPSHTFSQLALRLISNYWRVSQSKLSVDTLAPLQGFFETVSSHFGFSQGGRLLTELRCVLGFLHGLPIEILRQRYPKVPVDRIGDHLAKMYAVDESASGSTYISRGLKQHQLQFRRRFQEAILKPSWEEDDIRAYYSPANLPHLFSVPDLRALAREIDAYLDPAYRVQAKSEDKRGLDLFRRRIRAPENGLSRKQMEARFRMNLMRDVVLARVPLDQDVLNSIMVLSPFPNAAIAKIACLTAKFRPMPEVLSQENGSLDSFMRTHVLLVGFYFLFLGQSRVLSRAIATLINGIIAASFLVGGVKDRRKSFDIPCDHLNRWLMLLAALREIFYANGQMFPQNFRSQESWLRVLARIHEESPNEIGRILLREFPTLNELPNLDSLKNGALSISKLDMQRFSIIINGTEEARRSLRLPPIEFSPVPVTDIDGSFFAEHHSP